MPTSVAVDPYGNVLYAGTASDSKGSFIVFGLLDKSGSRLWAHRIDGTGVERNPVVKVVPGASGGVLLLEDANGSENIARAKIRRSSRPLCRYFPQAA